jgi:geranylgeranyl diphosphate synthase type II
MGAIAAGASSKNQEYLYEFGKHLGLSFQLLDDLLDAFAKDPEKFGKRTGGDILANKKTFLLLKAMELADEKQSARIQACMRETEAERKINTMLDLYTELHVGEFCQQEADKHTHIAIDYLNKIEAAPEKKLKLKEFALELLNRQV